MGKIRRVQTIFEHAEYDHCRQIATYLRKSNYCEDDSDGDAGRESEDDIDLDYGDNTVETKVNLACNRKGRTLLMYAVKGGGKNTVRLLIDHGADVHRVDHVRTFRLFRTCAFLLS